TEHAAPNEWPAAAPWRSRWRPAPKPKTRILNSSHWPLIVDAAEFAEEPIQVVSEWESGCRRTRDAVEPDDRRAQGGQLHPRTARRSTRRGTQHREPVGMRKSTHDQSCALGLAKLLRVSDDRLSALLGEPVGPGRPATTFSSPWREKVRPWRVLLRSSI